VRKGNIFDPVNGIEAKTYTHTISFAMNKYHKSLLFGVIALLVACFQVPANAQDDLYYDPATDTRPVIVEDAYAPSDNITRRYDDNDGYADDDDDYAYEYSSRIRRFHRPARVVDYYDPFFVDLWYYDPFFLPGNTIYTYGYNDYWSYRRWRRWQRWNNNNAWNSGFYWGNNWNTWGWNSCYNGWNAWNNPWAFQNYYYDPYWTWNGYNPYYGGGWNNGWVNNQYYYNNNNGGNNNGYRPQTYTGIRTGGTQVNPGYARIAGSNGRLTPTGKDAPVIEMKSRPGTGRLDNGVSKAPNGGVDDRGNVRNNGNTQSRRPESDVRNNGSDVRSGRTEETPSRRPNDATPSRRPENDTRPSRTDETRPSRRTDETRPSRREEQPATRRTEESRPTRRSEERSYERPSRNDNNSRSNERSQESRPSRSNDGGSSGRSGSGGNSGGGGGRGGDSGGSRSGGGGRGGRG
jgi:hypothetical protein